MSVEAIEKIIADVELTDEWNQPGRPQEVLTRRREILEGMFGLGR